MQLAAVICAFYGISADKTAQLLALKAFDGAFLFKCGNNRRSIAREIAQLPDAHRARVFQDIDDLALLLRHLNIVRALA